MVNVNGNLYPVLMPPKAKLDLIQSNFSTSHQAELADVFPTQYSVFDFNHSHDQYSCHEHSRQSYMQLPTRKNKPKSPFSNPAVSHYNLIKVAKNKPKLQISNQVFHKNKIDNTKKKSPAVNKEKHHHSFDSEEDFWNAFNQYWEELERENKTDEKLVKHIFWHRKPLSLYKLYQTVQFAGGYRKAISHWKIWRNVCWEVIGNQDIDSQFLTVRKAYRKVLLQFEKRMKDDVFSKRKEATPQLNRCTTSASSTITSSETLPGRLSTIPPSPVFPPPLLPRDLGLVRTNTNEEEQSPLVMLNGKSGEILKGLAPNISQKVKAAVNDLPSSNPDSPMCLFSPGCCSTPTLSDVGLDAAMEQLDDLEGKLGFLHSSQESLPVILTEDIFLDASNCPPKLEETKVLKSYQPTTQESVEFDDVMGELTDLEDTLLELAGDILSGSNMH